MTDHKPFRSMANSLVAQARVSLRTLAENLVDETYEQFGIFLADFEDGKISSSAITSLRDLLRETHQKIEAGETVSDIRASMIPRQFHDVMKAIEDKRIAFDPATGTVQAPASLSTRATDRDSEKRHLNHIEKALGIDVVPNENDLSERRNTIVETAEKLSSGADKAFVEENKKLNKELTNSRDKLKKLEQQHAAAVKLLSDSSGLTPNQNETIDSFTERALEKITSSDDATAPVTPPTEPTRQSNNRSGGKRSYGPRPSRDRRGS